MNAKNIIVPCPGLSARSEAIHPAAMAAAQLIIINGLDMDEMARAMTAWDEIMEEGNG